MVFADSSGFVAAFDRRDGGHRAMADAWRRLAAAGTRFVTTQLVFAESATLLRRRAGWKVARDLGGAILANPRIEVVGLGEDDLRAAWSEFVRSGDPKLSFCDAASFVVMRQRGIEQALSTDRHFRDAGFDLLP